MSRVLRTVEITPQRLDWLADDAVGFEPVSQPNSLQTGKLTGNFGVLPPLPRFLRPVIEQIQMLPAKFPTQWNREIFSTEQGNSTTWAYRFPAHTADY